MHETEDSLVPNTLFLAPRAFSESEIWMERITRVVPPERRTFVSVIHQHGVAPDTMFLGQSNRIGSSWFWMRVLPLVGNRRLSQILDETKPEVVVVHYATTALQYRRPIQRRRIPMQIHVHGHDVTWSGGGLRFWAHRGPFLRRRFVHLSQHATIVANSEYIASRLVDAGVARENIRVRTFGVPVPEASQITSPRSGLLFPGRLIDFKGPLESLEAFAKIAPEFPDETLVFAGAGPLEARIKKRVLELALTDRVCLLGKVSNERMLHLMATSKLLLTHSQYGQQSGQSEALGVVYIEAMGHGLPIVSARHGGFVELVEAADSGTLVTPGDIDAQAAAIRQLLSDPTRRQQMGDNGRRYVQSHNTLDIEARVFKRLLADDKWR